MNRRPARILNGCVAIGICLLLAFGVLAFGAVEESAIFILQAGAVLLLIAWAAGAIAFRLQVAFNRLFVPLLILAGLVALQLVLNRSAYWFATWQKALLWSVYGILFFLVTQCFRTPTALKGFAIAASIFGFLVAMFAIAQQFIGNGKYYWIMPNQAGGPFFGPYANHAHYSGLMEMLIPFPLVLALARWPSVPQRVLYGFSAAIMATSIFLSQSRGGILAFAAELGLLAILAARGRRARRQMALLVSFAALLIACLMLIQPVGLWERFTELGKPMDSARDPSRVTILKDSLKIVKERPLLGWGFGAFPIIYPSFRSFYTDFSVNAAHDDFLEITVETGLLGLGIALSFLYLLFRVGITRVKHWTHEPGNTTALAALVGCMGLIVHSFSDFNLQVPANAALFFSLAAIATTTSFTEDLG